MKIQLVDRNEMMCQRWEEHFKDCNDVIIHNGDFFSLETDCVVSPANSFGFMDGGLDYVISETLGWQIQNKLRVQLGEKYNGELLVGLAELVETDNEKVPYCISAPTMRVPLTLINNVNVYLASKAIFRILLENTHKIKSVTISGLGTGVGSVPYDICAKQMKKAYDEVWLDKQVYPESLKIAMKEHQYLVTL